ncbi:MAG: DUF86 domain-containing protein [Reichenbachiella sp.]|uniref:HepT-like ribonuclease domain-containing protein n=1 Tax=Reichenbachiella sp. TaxID=2184521 RepID=UPI002966459B|nr:DUF86 domain-containing protein [Reichenbachiella sp.]MDW3210015.1 DUF86 domain-containing protein [Reichenbachiella sp.]
MSKRDHRLLLLDIKEASNKIIKYTTDLNLTTFQSDDKTIDAVVRNFEIIGEAANHLGAEFKSEHNHIPWRKLIGFRNRIVHEYFGVDIEIVWSIIENDIEVLQFQIEEILRDE